MNLGEGKGDTNIQTIATNMFVLILFFHPGYFKLLNHASKLLANILIKNSLCANREIGAK